MSQTLIGYRAAQEAITTGGETLALMKSLKGCTNDSKLVDIYCGALVCVVESYKALRAAGIKPKGFDAEINDFLDQPPAAMMASLTISLNQRLPIADRQVDALATVVDANKGKISFDSPKVVTDEPAPLRIEIVSMPARVNLTEVARDHLGQITEAQQITRDA